MDKEYEELKSDLKDEIADNLRSWEESNEKELDDIIRKIKIGIPRTEKDTKYREQAVYKIMKEIYKRNLESVNHFIKLSQKTDYI